MGIDLGRYAKDKAQMEDCEHAKEVTSKYGIQIVCSEEDAEENQMNLHLPADDHCENSKEVASKYGIQIICDEEK